jgi:hypothetical protein
MHVEDEMMLRTSLMLPAALKLEAQRIAEERGVSLGDLVREALASFVQRAREDGGRDPLFADTEVWEGEVPVDVSARHDEYLYGDDA